MNPNEFEQEQEQQQFDTTQTRAAETSTLDSATLKSITDETIRRQAQTVLVEEQRFVLSQRRARMFSMSGLFQDKAIPAGSEIAVARAMVKIELGESMGFSAAEALQGIHIINGQTCISSALRAGRMQAAGYDWVIQWHGSHDEPAGCTLWLLKDGKPMQNGQPQVWTHQDLPMFPWVDEKTGKPVVDSKGNHYTERCHESFVQSDAERMLTTIWEGPKGRAVPKRVSILQKDNWKMSPRNMYFARAVTNAQRFWAPKVLSVSLMSVEEALDLNDVVEETTRRDTNVEEFLTSRAGARAHVMEESPSGTGTVLDAMRVAVEKLARLGKLDEAKATAKKHGIQFDFAQFEQGPTETTANLDIYREKLGDETFLRVLGKYDARQTSDVKPADFQKLLYDLEDALRMNVRKPANGAPQSKLAGMD